MNLAYGNHTQMAPPISTPDTHHLSPSNPAQQDPYHLDADSDPHHDHSSETTPSDTCAEFSLFNKLPPELRLKIWRFEFLQGRRVEVGIIQFGNDGGTIGHSRTPNPSTLSVNRESREETLKHYKGRFEGRGQRVHYFYPDVDTTFLKEVHYPDDKSLAKIDSGTVKVLELYNILHVKRMVLWSCSNPGSEICMSMNFIASGFHNLEHLALVPFYRRVYGASPGHQAA